MGSSIRTHTRTGRAFRFCVELFAATATFVLALGCAESAWAYKATLVWSAVPEATAYNIYVHHASGPVVGNARSRNRAPEQIERTITIPHRRSQGLEQSYTVGSLPLGPTVFFTVRATNSGVESNASKQRFLAYNRVATVVDSDGDGLTDAEEDKDLDGILDAGETNSLKRDTDGDGVEDGEELFDRGTDPRNRDTDRDGVDDADDRCNDIDRDGYGSQLVGGTCPFDNCPWTYNTSQRDIDLDSVGDACDPCTNIGNLQNFYQNDSLVFRRVNTDTNPEDDSFEINGDFRLPSYLPFDSLDPAQTGARVVVRTANGERILDVILPPGEFDRETRERGWRRDQRERTWRYVERRPTRLQSVTRLSFTDMSNRWPQTVRIAVRGRNGDYPVDYADAPLFASIALGDQNASKKGACAETPYTASDCVFLRGGKTVACE
jgi:hypothetical protein